MGSEISKQIQRRKDVLREAKVLRDLSEACGTQFPCCDYLCLDRKNWMNGLGPEKIPLFKIVWPGTHDSATNKIGVPFVSRPFAQCQSLSIYDQLVGGTRVFDIRVQVDRRVCHGILATYSVDAVLISQDEGVFGKTIAEMLPKRVICVWKPRNSPKPKAGGPLWSEGYLKDDWINTDLPSTKFDSNMKHLGEQPPAPVRKYFYRVENTVTPQADNPIVCVKPVTNRIRGYARLFISQCFSKGLVDRLQIFSTDFIDGDFVDACIGLTSARIEGKA